MTYKGILNAAQKFVGDNTPGILTGFGVAGAVATAVMAAKAGFKTSQLLHDMTVVEGEPENKEFALSTRETVQLVWKEYIPAAIVGAATITVIIAANQVGARRTAALAAAFKISEQISDDYKKKVVEVVGKKTEEGIRAQIATERSEKDPSHQTIIISGSGAVFYDEFSGRYFSSDVESIRKSVNDINHQVMQHYFASLSDFYDLIGLPKTQVSDEFGWNTDNLLEVKFVAFMTDDNRAALSMEYNKTPIRGYDRVN